MLSYKNIIKDDNQDLRKKAEAVVLPLSQKEEKLILDMRQYLLDGYDESKVEKEDIRPGVGLSAPQLDVLKKMFVIYAYDERNKLYDIGVINPKILSYSEEKTYLPTGEGCLSVARKIEGFIHRAKRIKVAFDAYDFTTGKITRVSGVRLKGYIAVIFQHEYDHLNGILFYDHINKADPFFIPKNSHPIHFDDDEKGI